VRFIEGPLLRGFPVVDQSIFQHPQQVADEHQIGQALESVPRDARVLADTSTNSHAISSNVISLSA